jgi:DNA-binding MarR family transcriptional regulator
MSRGFDDARDDHTPAPELAFEPAAERTSDRPSERAPGDRTSDRDAADRTSERDLSDRANEPDARDHRPEVPMHHLDLPRTEHREPVTNGDRTYQLRESEVKILATVGTFRSVPAHDLAGAPSGRDVWLGDLKHLSEQGLIERTTVTINHEPSTVFTLTREGRDLLESHQHTEDGRANQSYYADAVKPRELGHDAQLYRLFQEEAAKIEAAGGRIERVVIDAELKREYQTFLNRPDRDDEDHADDMRAFADAWDLPVIDDHLALPDLRIEYETADGRLDHRDVELVSEHYSRGQMAAKAQAGFSMYRAGGGGRGGGTPFDPHHLKALV